jgi:hypothetical protein
VNFTLCNDEGSDGLIDNVITVKSDGNCTNISRAISYTTAGQTVKVLNSTVSIQQNEELILPQNINFRCVNTTIYTYVLRVRSLADLFGGMEKCRIVIQKKV